MAVAQGHVPGREEVTRSSYPGKPLLSGNRVTSVSYVPFGQSERLRICDVGNIKEYSAGCKLHAGCFGHMCSTPTGITLAPQSISVRVGPISTQFLRASSHAFFGETEAYLSDLTATCLTKHGHMRVTQSTPVAGSGRLVAIPQVSYPLHVVCVSKLLAGCLKFEYVDMPREGVRAGTSRWKTLEEGDWCILVRPPSLTTEAFQPVVVKFWDHPAMGIHPELFTQLHGDYDGDEAHLYPLGDQRSVAEAKSWVHTKNHLFERARHKFRELKIGTVVESDADLGFMGTTTISTKQLYDGDTGVLFGEETRNPSKHVSATTARFHDRNTERDFVAQSIRGTADIMKQQLSQSSIGELSRLARIAASCFTRKSTGELVCAARGGIIVLDPGPVFDKGVPSCRAVMRICSVAQQALLDSHRAGTSATRGTDLIANMLRGSRIGSDDLDEETLCIFPRGVKLPYLTLWKLEVGNRLIALVTVRTLSEYHYTMCIGAYSPRILRMVPQHSRVRVCRLGIEHVCSYYSISLTETELMDLSYCLSYRPDMSLYPTTSRSGMVDRELSWLDTMMATDFKKQPGLANSRTYPITATSAMYTSNFSKFVEKHQ